MSQRTGRRIRLGDELLVTVRGVDMDKRTIDLALTGTGGGADGTSKPQSYPNAGPAYAKASDGRGKWDETRPQGHSSGPTKGQERSFGKSGKKAAAESRERQRRSLGKKKKR